MVWPARRHDWSNRVYNAGGVTMATLAKNGLSSAMDRYVIDRTGIAGDFNFRLEFGIDENTPDRMGQIGLRPPAPNTDAPRGPSIFAAIEKLGLKLESITGPTQFIVIDRAARPAPDSPLTPANSYWYNLYHDKTY
jgi:uncharacterized protein (TIGR03435 family)